MKAILKLIPILCILTTLGINQLNAQEEPARLTKTTFSKSKAVIKKSSTPEPKDNSSDIIKPVQTTTERSKPAVRNKKENSSIHAIRSTNGKALNINRTQTESKKTTLSKEDMLTKIEKLKVEIEQLKNSDEENKESALIKLNRTLENWMEKKNNLFPEKQQSK